MNLASKERHTKKNLNLALLQNLGIIYYKKSTSTLNGGRFKESLKACINWSLGISTSSFAFCGFVDHTKEEKFS